MTSAADSHWNSYIQHPVCVEDPDELNWDDQTELAVVGGGAAGASAALEAAEAGLSTLLIDRFNGGGASALSGGVIYLGGGTWCQKEAGFNDNPEEMFRYLQLEAKGVVRDETLRRFCEESVETLQWLESHGVQFSASLSPVKTSYPTKQYFLYYSGNEIVSEYREVARPAPRGHRPIANGFSGQVLMQSLLGSCERSENVGFCFHSRVHRLITDQKGTVLGLEILQIDPSSSEAGKFSRCYKLYDRTRIALPPLSLRMQKVMESIEANEQVVWVRRIRATRGVVLAAGGFIFNRPMAKHYTPDYARGMQLGSPGCDGSGIRLGESVGAVTDLMEKGSAWRFINPPQAFVEGVVVNPEGERFVNEVSYGARIGERLVEKYDGTGALIINGEILRKVFPQLMPWRAWFLFQSALVILSLLLCTRRAKTLEQLARKCGLPVEKLQQTVRAYNEAIASGRQDPLGKAGEFRHSLANGPYYAIDISVDNPVFKCATLTFGGLQVDEDTGQVKRDDGGVFKNLYAAGRCAVGIPSRSYVSGLSLADCIFSGRRAARHVAQSG